MSSLANRRVLVTGASQGLGLVIARSFASAGAHVALCARDPVRLEEARREIQAGAPSGVQVIAATADISSPEQVTALVERTVGTLGSLDVVVANAGIYGPKGRVEDVPWDEWVQAIHVNLFGTVLTCRAVVPHLRRQGWGKIIILSGGGATKGMPTLSAYAASKAGVVRFAETLAGELADSGVDVNCVAPGAMNTRMLEEILEAGPERVDRPFYEAALRQKAGGGDSPEVAAELCLFLASEASDGITGRLISAKWDPWRGLPEHRDVLRASDIYLLRRVVPEDRGRNWGGG
jgi:3-oxoacyl-[acyl-carrier protein] reductase